MKEFAKKLKKKGSVNLKVLTMVSLCHSSSHCARCGGGSGGGGHCGSGNCRCR